MLNGDVFLNWVGQFLLIFIRVAAIFTVSPVFGRKNVPSILKIMFSILLSYILIGVFPPPPDTGRFDQIIVYGAACIKELVVGLTIGYVTTLFFSLAFTAGEIIDIQIGFGMVQLYDAQMETQVPLMGNFLNMMMLLSFFSVNGHHMLIKILAETFKSMPPGSFHLNLQVGMVIVDFFVLALIMALKVAMPVLAASFITEVALGLILRTVPQMNMFVVGIPLKIVTGLLVMLLILPVFMGLTDGIFNQMFDSVRSVFSGMVTA